MEPLNALKQAACIALAASSSASLASADVLVVDSSGGGSYTEISHAIAVAADGDLVLIRPGVYFAPVVVDGVGISIVARDPDSVVMTDALTVRNVTAGGLAVLSGLQLDSGFTIEDCAGDVQMQECTVPPTAWVTPSILNTPTACGTGGSLQSVVRCGRVTITECDFTGADGGFNPWDGQPG